MISKPISTSPVLSPRQAFQVALAAFSFYFSAFLPASGAGEEEAISQMKLLDGERILKVGDRLTYSVVEDRERPRLIFVNDRGEVEVPLLGRVPAAGQTCQALAYAIKEKLEVDFYYRATVLIAFPLLSDSRGEVTVLGEVVSPGPRKIPMDDILTVSNAILRAGGFTARADGEAVVLVRKDPVNPEGEIRSTINVAEIFTSGDFKDDATVEPEDLILVPQLATVGGQFYIYGAVNAPKLYDIPNEKDFTVSKAILLAGGFSKFADKKRVKLIRADPSLSEKEKTLTVNVAQILEKGIRTFDPVIQPDDIIRVQERWFNIQ